MSDLAIAAARVCSKCGQDLFLLNWNEQWTLLICDNFCCNLFRTPQGHIERNGGEPELEFDTPGAAGESGIMLPLGEGGEG